MLVCVCMQCWLKLFFCWCLLLLPAGAVDAAVARLLALLRRVLVKDVLSERSRGWHAGGEHAHTQNNNARAAQESTEPGSSELYYYLARACVVQVVLLFWHVLLHM